MLSVTIRPRGGFRTSVPQLHLAEKSLVALVLSKAVKQRIRFQTEYIGIPVGDRLIEVLKRAAFLSPNGPQRT